jgi:hypothetical protein
MNRGQSLLPVNKKKNRKVLKIALLKHHTIKNMNMYSTLDLLQSHSQIPLVYPGLNGCNLIINK